MGIKLLNNYLIRTCSKNAIHSISFLELRGKTIVIDAFIYLYKYLGENRLEERFKQLITLCKENDICPIFVFDGKPPEEKKTLLHKRREKKKDAEQLYNTLLLSGSTESLPYLKSQFVRIGYNELQIVKNIMTECNVQFIEAPHEADRICAEYVLTGSAWACMSDDMDMFAYGCEHVLRNLCLDTFTVDLYSLPVILNELKMTIIHFREVLVISGTDYNTTDNVSLYYALRLFRQYKYKVNHNKYFSFYDWLYRTTTAIHDWDALRKIYVKFA